MSELQKLAQVIHDSFWGMEAGRDPDPGESGDFNAGDLQLAYDIRRKNYVRQLSDEELLKKVIDIDAELVNRLLFRYDNEARFGVKEFRNALQAALITKETNDLREEYFQKGYQAGLFEAFEVASVEVVHEHKRNHLRPTDYWIGAAAIMNRLNKRITEAKGQSWSSVTPDPLED